MRRLPASNIYGDDRLEEFTVESFDGYRKRGTAGNSEHHFRVVWNPRILEPDPVFPDEFPAVIGRRWDRYDED